MAVGSVIEMAHAIMRGDIKNGYSLVRPPGHHAIKKGGMGYCLFSNLGIALSVIKRDNPGIKIAVVDWDVHHGNGTQDVFYDDPDVLTISLHQDRLYPRNSGMREEIAPPQSSPVTVIGEYINSHINNVLVVNDGLNQNNMVPLPTLEPKGELLIRYEPDTKELFIAAKQFKDFCVKQQINYKTTLKELGDAKIYLEGVNKRMSKGMKVVSPAVRVLKFDASASEFLHMDTLVTTDEDRDSNVSD